MSPTLVVPEGHTDLKDIYPPFLIVTDEEAYSILDLRNHFQLQGGERTQ